MKYAQFVALKQQKLSLKLEKWGPENNSAAGTSIS
jgi:hypothetical protein